VWSTAFNPLRDGITMKASVAVVVAAVLLAVAYAMWSETSQVLINAQTGYIDLDIVLTGPDPWFYDPPYGYPYVSVSYTLAGSDPGNDGPPVLTLTLSNLYPGINYIVFDAARLRNDGTLPVRIKNCNFKFIGGSFTFGDVDYDGWLDIDVDVHKSPSGVGPPSPIILNPGEEAVLAIAFRVDSDAPEGASVTVQFTCDYEQAVP